MTSPLWTQSRHTNDQGETTVTDLTPAQEYRVAGAICEFLSYGKYTDAVLTVTGLVTAEAKDAADAAIGRLLSAADAAGKPITTADTTDTSVAAIARSLNTPQWS